MSTPWTLRWLVVQLHLFLTSVLGGGEWSASCPGRFIPGKQSRYSLHRRLDWSYSQTKTFAPARIRIRDLNHSSICFGNKKLTIRRTLCIYAFYTIYSKPVALTYSRNWQMFVTERQVFHAMKEMDF
jgi:hypothetical protein